MSSCDPWTFNCTSQQLDCMREALKAHGIMVPSGNSGNLEGDGVDGSFSWDSGILTIHVTKHSFLFPCSVMKEKIQSEINNC